MDSDPDPMEFPKYEKIGAAPLSWIRKNTEKYEKIAAGDWGYVKIEAQECVVQVVLNPMGFCAAIVFGLLAQLFTQHTAVCVPFP